MTRNEIAIAAMQAMIQGRNIREFDCQSPHGTGIALCRDIAESAFSMADNMLNVMGQRTNNSEDGK